MARQIYAWNIDTTERWMDRYMDIVDGCIARWTNRLITFQL